MDKSPKASVFAYIGVEDSMEQIDGILYDTGSP